MKFTKQDAITFGIGAAAALAFEAGVWMVKLPVQAETPDFSVESFGVSMGVGIVGALGRYLVTRIPERFLKVDRQNER